MITVEEAKRLLFENIPSSKTIELEIRNVFGHVLAEDIFSPVDLPLFNQSMMDGYAIAAGEMISRKQFNLKGEIKAGDIAAFNLNDGEAVRIFTGAPVPTTADMVVMQEKVRQENGSIYLSEDILKDGFIRMKGSQIKKGDLALKKISLLNPASLGFLASLGLEKVKVYAKPNVSILVTGDEIIIPGNALQNGQVYKSNSFSLQAALQQMQININNILTSQDDKEELKNKLSKCLSDSDVILITGGISVGKYDFVKDVLKELNVETVFYKVAQKPGKPLFLGRLNDKLIFALPGNPASALVCFYEYAYPAIRKMQGIEKAMLVTVQLKTEKDISKKEDRAFFIHSKSAHDLYRGLYGVMPLEMQDSSMLRSFAEADALIYIPIEKKNINRGEMVEVHLFPFSN